MPKINGRNARERGRYYMAVPLSRAPTADKIEVSIGRELGKVVIPTGCCIAAVLTSNRIYS